MIVTKVTRRPSAGPQTKGAGPVKVAVLAPSFPPAFKAGGPARTLDALTRSTPPSHAAYVFTPDTDLDPDEHLAVVSNAWSTHGSVNTFYASVGSLRHLVTMYREVARLEPQVVYLNSIFNLKLSIIPRLLVAVRWWRPQDVLIAPRGEFSPGALAIRTTKKKAFLSLYRLLRLHRGVVWHASSPMEEEAIRRMWVGPTEVVTREDETGLPDDPLPPGPSDDVVRAVFLSRISPMKGLDILLDALRSVSSACRLDVYGPPEDPRYLARCQDLANRVPSHITVRFLGSVQHFETRDIFAHHDLLTLPTRGENFGHVIAEALSASCPVMVPDTTPWTPVVRDGGGYVVDPNSASAWAAAIEAFAQLPVARRHAVRLSAGSAYRDWRRHQSAPHVFELLASRPSPGLHEGRRAGLLRGRL